MGNSVWAYILKLFGKENREDSGRMGENSQYAEIYEEVEHINFTAIFAGKLSSLAFGESTADVVGRGKREVFLDQCLAELWGKRKKICAGMLGLGGYAAVPYVRGGQIFFDLVPQNRLMITGQQGNKITGAIVLAETAKEGERVYYRWVEHRVEDGILYMTNHVTNAMGQGVVYAPWENLGEHAIGGVEQVLFGFFKSPVDNRRGEEAYGVPITYGCEALIEEIHECLREIREEFSLKQVRIFADERLFKRDQVTGRRTMPSKAFLSGNLENSSSMMEVFSPEVRHSSYYARLSELFSLLEKAVGTSRGILTTPTPRGVTATEIKAGVYDTFSMVMDIRRMFEEGVRGYLKACEVLANYYDLAPMGRYEVVFDWDYSLVESSEESWSQMKDAVALGIRSKGEARQWLCANETLAQAEEKVRGM